MTIVSAISAPDLLAGAPMLNNLGLPAPAAAAQTASFGDILAAGVKTVDAKLTVADTLVQKFALDGSVPIHQVTFALEEARMSLELAMQVRARFLEGYREIMNMQL